MLGDHPAKGLEVFQRPPHHAGVLDTAPVIGEEAHSSAGAGHQAQLGKLFSPKTFGDGADGLDVGKADRPPAVEEEFGGLCGVGRWGGVGHRQDRGEAAGGRCCRATGDRLGVLASRFSQMGMQVHEPGSSAGRRPHVTLSGASAIRPISAIRPSRIRTSAVSPGRGSPASPAARVTWAWPR